MRLSSRLTSVCLLALGLFALSLAPTPPAAAAAERCFPETGQCLSGRFLSFWEEQGGLPVFGFPTTPARVERSRDDGQPYLTQWFERVRFELHPELAPPYDVLLGRIGAERLELDGIDWRTLPRAGGPQPGCRWFPETGVNVCDQVPGLGFLSYWQRHGPGDPRLDGSGQSLALFGLPLGEAAIAVSPTDGRPYLTQWFERARFEWHPAQPDDAYKVLLGLLGNEVRTAPRRLGQHVLTSFAAAGQVVVRVEAGGRLVAYDLADDATTVIVAGALAITAPATDGRTVAWVEDAPGGRQQLWRYDRATGQRARVLETPGPDERVNRLAVAGNTIYLEREAPGRGGLIAVDLASGAEQLIAAQGRNPVTDGRLLLWTETRSTGSGPAFRSTHRLMLRDLASTQPDRELARLDDQNGFSRYAISGTRVVWAGFGTPVSVLDLATGATTSPGTGGFYPTIAAETVLWARQRERGGWTLFATDLATGRTQIALDDGAVELPFVVVGDHVAYPSVARQGAADLYLRRLP